METRNNLLVEAFGRCLYYHALHAESACMHSGPVCFSSLSSYRVHDGTCFIPVISKMVMDIQIKIFTFRLATAMWEVPWLVAIVLGSSLLPCMSCYGAVLTADSMALGARPAQWRDLAHLPHTMLRAPLKQDFKLWLTARSTPSLALPHSILWSKPKPPCLVQL